MIVQIIHETYGFTKGKFYEGDYTKGKRYKITDDGHNQVTIHQSRVKTMHELLDELDELD